MNRIRVKSAPAMALAAALVVPILLILAARPGTGQEKAGAAAPPSRVGQQGTVESHDRTNFPLTGKHRTLACRECHINLVFEGTPTDCEVCHWMRRQDDRYCPPPRHPLCRLSHAPVLEEGRSGALEP